MTLHIKMFNWNYFCHLKTQSTFLLSWIIPRHVLSQPLNHDPSKKLPNVYKSCPKIISIEKWTILTPLQKLPNNVDDLGLIIVATGFEKLPKVQKIAQSGHTDHEFILIRKYLPRCRFNCWSWRQQRVRPDVVRRGVRRDDLVSQTVKVSNQGDLQPLSSFTSFGKKIPTLAQF